MDRERLQELKAQLETPNHYTVSDILMRVIDALLEDDGAGWIEWNGSVTPPFVDGPVEVQYRDGRIQHGSRDEWDWLHHNEGDDIVRYRPVGEETDTGWVKSSDWSEGTISVPGEDYYLMHCRPVDSPPRVDRSLRGPCAVTTEDGTMLMYANDHGLSYYSDAAGAVGDMPWDRAEESNIIVRKLTPEDLGHKVRRWHQLSDREQSEYEDGCDGTTLQFGHHYSLAIDIATREVPHE
ncbi:MAG: hypothetical protein ACOCSK_00335 [Rhodothermales bacterium]